MICRADFQSANAGIVPASLPYTTSLSFLVALGNFPIAAAYSLVPIAIMLVYLLIARRLGAFDSL